MTVREAISAGKPLASLCLIGKQGVLCCRDDRGGGMVAAPLRSPKLKLRLRPALL